MDIRPDRNHRVLPFCAVACAAACTVAAAAAEPAFGDDARSAWQNDAAASHTRYEVNTTVLPGGPEASPLYPAGAALSGSGTAGATQYVDVTRWLDSGTPGSGFGLVVGLGAPAPSAATAATAAAWAAPGAATGPLSMDLGLRWRSRLDSARHLDVSAWAQAPRWSQPQDAMGMIWQSQGPTVATRLEVQWASSRTRGLVPEFGAVGVQLQGGSKLVLRARKGGPMLYYRAKF